MTIPNLPRFGWRGALFVAITLAAALLWPPEVARPSPARPVTPNEYDMKAALVFNFAKFVDWPASALAPGAPFVIGVVGDDPIGPALERLLRGQTVAGRAIVIRRWHRARERGACQMLFVSGSEQLDLKELLREVGEMPVLTVADMPEFARQGGMIGIVVADKRLRFEINTVGTDRAHLKVSSRLLSLAKIVSPTP